MIVYVKDSQYKPYNPLHIAEYDRVILIEQVNGKLVLTHYVGSQTTINPRTQEIVGILPNDFNTK